MFRFLFFTDFRRKIQEVLIVFGKYMYYAGVELSKNEQREISKTLKAGKEMSDAKEKMP